MKKTMKTEKPKRKKTLKRKLIFTLSLLGAALICVGLLLLSRRLPKLTTNVYTKHIFKYISLPVKWLFNLFPFSVGEVILLVLIVAVPLALIISVILCFRRKSAKPIARYGLNIVALASAAVILFVIFGGFNYSTLTFAERNGYDVHDSDIYELMELCEYLNDKAAECRNKLSQDENGVVTTTLTVYDMFYMASDGYDALLERFPDFKGFYTTPKPALTSTAMCYFQISGIYPYISPEAIVNVNTPLFELPHTICHEMAHQRGVAREDEANYVGYLAAISNPDPLFQYSGYAQALSYCLNALYSASSAAYDQVRPRINVGILRDMSAANKFWRSFEQKNELPAKISTAVNDTYLQIQNIPDGTRSYGRMVDLLLAEFRLSKG
ncbi:MAG: DUF3810 domain-containing protein [Clostridia bacterium]|nr:DUF3810 domain-containing protein [Clostridia bacterium]